MKYVEIDSIIEEFFFYKNLLKKTGYRSCDRAVMDDVFSHMS